MKKMSLTEPNEYGCKKKMDNSWAPRRKNWGKFKTIGYSGYKGKIQYK